jgi:superoxide dismutase, Fe-Mn family
MANKTNNRRDFLKTTGKAGLAAALSLPVLDALAIGSSQPAALKTGTALQCPGACY